MTAFLLLVPAAAAALILAPLVKLACRRDAATRADAKRAMRRNLAGFGAACLLAVLLPVGALAAVPEATAAASAGVDGFAQGMGFLAAALVTGMAAIGAGIAVAAAAPAAIGAFSEDPKSFGKSLIFVALGEGVAIYGLLISILILNKI